MRILKNLALLGGLGVALFAVLWALIQTNLIDDYTLQILCSAGLNIMVALSLNLISGFTGQLALGHAGFLAMAPTQREFCSWPRFPFSPGHPGWRAADGPSGLPHRLPGPAAARRLPRHRHPGVGAKSSVCSSSTSAT